MPLPRPTLVSNLKIASIALVPARITLRGAARSGSIAKPVGAALRAQRRQRLEDRVGAVDRLDVPAQRQHVAPIAVGMEQRLQQRRRRTSPALLRTAPANCRRQPKCRPSCRACAFPVTGRLCGVSLPAEPIPIRDGAERAWGDGGYSARATACGPDPAERGRSGYRDRPACTAAGPRLSVTLSHWSSFGAKPDHAAPKRCRRRPVPIPWRACGSGLARRTSSAWRPAVSGSSGDVLRWVRPTRPEYFIWSPKCRCSVSRKPLLPAMSTIGDRRCPPAVTFTRS